MIKLKKKKLKKSEKNKFGMKVRRVFAVAIVALAVWLLFVFSDMFGWAGDDENVAVSIPDGCSVVMMADILEQEDLIDYKFAFRLYEKMDGNEHLFRKGVHILNKSMGYGDIIDKLTQKPDAELGDFVRVNIPEGFENKQIADRLAQEGLVDRDKFLNELENGVFEYEFVKAISRTENRLEGYLYPATYDIYPGETEHDIICKMLDAFQENVMPVYTAAETVFTLDQIVTLASMVEREAANDSERGLVASVFYNRMNADMTLSSCATIQYILNEHKTVLSNDDIAIVSPYNTYLNKGLPVGPIASPGLNSIRAALAPVQSEYMYFVARPDGSENVFTRTGEEHEQKKAEFYGNI